MKILLSLWAFAGILVCQGFVPLQQQSHRATVVRQSSLQEPPKDTEDVKHEIEEMRKEAQRRLQALTQQMEELKQETAEQKTTEKKETTSREKQHKETKQPMAEDSLDSLEGDLTKQPPSFKKEEEKTPLERQRPPEPARLDLLDDTRWKIVFNIGREPGTWMPKTWGASGERLRFEVIVDFGTETCYDREDFFQGVAGAKKLEVVDAWTFPVGVGDKSVGRRSIRIKPEGGYKVVRGQGPMGTDVVRLYLELEEEVGREGSDVYCPAGRVYGTCGYFPIRQATAADQRSWKDVLAEEHRAALSKYEKLQQEKELDTRLFSMDQLKRMKEIMDVTAEIDKLEKQLQEAQQREPERSMLRLSRKGDVGLSKEGGVCCKVSKGLALEYHILGRMELACVERREEHDEYEELVHELHH